MPELLARRRADAVAYGHLYIPVTDAIDGVSHQEVSLGSPQEWTGPGAKPRRVVQVAGGQAGA